MIEYWVRGGGRDHAFGYTNYLEDLIKSDETVNGFSLFNIFSVNENMVSIISVSSFAILLILYFLSKRSEEEKIKIKSLNVYLFTRLNRNFFIERYSVYNPNTFIYRKNNLIIYKMGQQQEYIKKQRNAVNIISFKDDFLRTDYQGGLLKDG